MFFFNLTFIVYRLNTIVLVDARVCCHPRAGSPLVHTFHSQATCWDSLLLSVHNIYYWYCWQTTCIHFGVCI